MDASEEFIVVDEKESAEQETVSRLKTLIDLFTKSLDAVNESNILLRDELRSALSVTLQYCPSDGTINTEDIVKALDENVTGVEEVRSKYIRHLCSKLVSVDSELKELRAQNEALKSSLELREKESTEQLNNLCNTMQTLETITKRHEDYSSVEDGKEASEENSEIPEKEGTHPANLISLCTSLASICDRLDKLDFGDPKVRTEMSDASVQTRSKLQYDSVAQTSSPRMQDASISTSTSLPTPRCEITNDAPTVPVPPYPTMENLSLPCGDSLQSNLGMSSKFLDHLNEVNRISSSVLPTIGARLNKLMQAVATSPLTNPTVDNSSTGTPVPEPETAQEPTFYAHDEEPWCPACSQYFASRTDLEEHLPLCLE